MLFLSFNQFLWKIINLSFNDKFTGFKKKEHEYLSFLNGTIICKSMSHSIMSDFVTPWTAATRILCPWNSPARNTGVGSRSLLQGIFLTQELNLGLLHHRQILCHLSPQESPIICTVMHFQLFEMNLGSSKPNDKISITMADSVT